MAAELCGSLTVSLDRIDTPIAGRVCGVDQPERPFTGWVGLFAALQAAVSALQQGSEGGAR